MDAARLLPVLGILLVMVPVLWGTDATRPSTSSAILYLFGIWAALVVLAFVVSSRLRHLRNAGDKSVSSDEADYGPV